jgi:hypothetical protein
MAATKALLLNFKSGETRNTVSRETVKSMATVLGFNETQVAMYALARLREEVLPAYAPDDHELSAKSIRAIRATARQDGYEPTRTLIKGL